MRIEVHYPPGLDVEVRLDPSASERLQKYGIQQIDLTSADDAGEIVRDEMYIWPPQGSGQDNDGIPH